ncbi:MAG: acetyl-CoA carboxylase biotin carboxyl carrier protein [Aureispira sp.]|nr:acetyl-CoA carboxylase biotin carboxyl carrier protein [Aureispira sp.]
MEFDQIKELIKLIQGSGVGEFKYENENMKVSIRAKEFTKNTEVIVQPMGTTIGNMQQPMQMAPVANVQAPVANNEALQSTPVAKEEEEDTSNYIEIKSPMIGTFYRSSTPDKPPFVKVGDVIGPDDTVCLIEAMKLFNEVKAEVSGRIVKVLVEDASPTEYDQVLFLVDPLA